MLTTNTTDDLAEEVLDAASDWVTMPGLRRALGAVSELALTGAVERLVRDGALERRPLAAPAGGICYRAVLSRSRGSLAMDA